MQKSPPTPSATSWSSRAAPAPFRRGGWLCAGQLWPGLIARNSGSEKTVANASRAMKDVLPGRVWARGEHHILVKDDEHRDGEYRYIKDKQGPGARAWWEGEPVE